MGSKIDESNRKLILKEQMKKAILWSYVLILAIQPVFCRTNSGGPDHRAPLGVMGDHMHKAGELMLSYRFVYMLMEGSRDESSRIADSDVIRPGGYNFMITPTRMPMQTHLFGLMFAPTGKMTFTAMLPLISYEMEHLHRNGTRFTTNSSGVGDPKVMLLYQLLQFKNQRIHLQAGASIPVGSITERDVTPASNPDDEQLPYPMQPGSGTVDLLPGITYFGQNGSWSWGGQATGVIRLAKNDNDYRLGNQLKTTFWADLQVSKSISLSARIEGTTWDNVEGSDPAFGLAVQLRTVPTVFADLRSGSSFVTGVGLNLYIPGSGLRFAFEGLLPVHQELTGPQLEADFTVIAGTQFSF
jgi:hypothetical protein